MSTKNIAIIPARAGSKRIPKKNIREFHGKPMIQYSIEAALDSGLFERVIVSTDSEEIRELVNQLGAEAPFLRPAEFSDDHTPLAEVLKHALKWTASNSEFEFENVCCLLATAPFVRAQELKEAFIVLNREKVPAVVPVTSFPFPIFRAFQKEDGGSLKLFWPEHELTRSNDLPEAFHDAGQFYWLKIEEFLKSGKIFAEGAKAYVLPRHRVQDIDTPEDWDRAERLFAAEFPERTTPMSLKKL